jgi:hypothetical protein
MNIQLGKLGSLFPLPTRILTYILLGLALLVGAGAVKDWYFPGPSEVGAGLTRTHYQRTIETPEVRRAPKKTVQRDVVIPELPPRQAEKVAERFGLDLDTDALLTKVAIPESPDGGEAAVTLGPSGQVEVTYKPNRPSFFDVGGPLEVGAGVTVNSHGQGIRLFGAKELARVGFVRLRLEGNLDVVSGQTDASASLLAVYRR